MRAQQWKCIILNCSSDFQTGYQIFCRLALLGRSILFLWWPVNAKHINKRGKITTNQNTSTLTGNKRGGCFITCLLLIGYSVHQSERALKTHWEYEWVKNESDFWFKGIPSIPFLYCFVESISEDSGHKKGESIVGQLYTHLHTIENSQTFVGFGKKKLVL